MRAFPFLDTHESTSMSIPHVFVLQSGPIRNPLDIAFRFDLSQFEGPEGTPYDKMLACIARLQYADPGHDRKPLAVAPWIVPVGAYARLSRDSLHQGETHINATFRTGSVRLLGRSFMQKNFLSSFQERPNLNPLDMIWDHIGIGLILGAVDGWGTVPRHHDKGFESAFLHILVAALHTLIPWQGKKHIPHRGLHMRPYPQNTAIDRAIADLRKTAFNPASRNDPRSFHALFDTGVLMGTTPYNASSWTRGPNFAAACALYPQDILETGRAISQVLDPDDSHELTWSNLLRVDSPLGQTAHETLALHAIASCLDDVLTDRLPHLRRP